MSHDDLIVLMLGDDLTQKVEETHVHWRTGKGGQQTENKENGEQLTGQQTKKGGQRSDNE